MHEVGIARNILEVVEQQLPADNTQNVKSIRVRVGTLARVTPDALRFGFQIASVTSPLRTAELLIDEIPLRVQCEDCEMITEIMQPLLICSACGHTRMTVLSGNELEVVDVQFE